MGRTGAGENNRGGRVKQGWVQEGQIGAQHLVGTAPGFAGLSEVQQVLLAIHQEVMTRDAELCTLVIIIPMPCSRMLLSQTQFTPVYSCEISSEVSV